MNTIFFRYFLLLIILFFSMMLLLCFIFMRTYTSHQTKKTKRRQARETNHISNRVRAYAYGSQFWLCAYVCVCAPCFPIQMLSTHVNIYAQTAAHWQWRLQIHLTKYQRNAVNHSDTCYISRECVRGSFFSDTPAYGMSTASH